MDGAATLSDERLLSPDPLSSSPVLASSQGQGQGQAQAQGQPAAVGRVRSPPRLSKLGAGRSESERLAALMLHSVVESSDGEGSLALRSSNRLRPSRQKIALQEEGRTFEEADGVDEYGGNGQVLQASADNVLAVGGRSKVDNKVGRRSHERRRKRRPGHRRSSSVGDYALVREAILRDDARVRAAELSHVQGSKAKSEPSVTAAADAELPTNQVRSAAAERTRQRLAPHLKSKSLAALPRPNEEEEGEREEDSEEATSMPVAPKEQPSLAVLPPTSRRPRLGASHASAHKKQASVRAIPRRSPEPVLSGRRDVLDDVAGVVSGRERADSSTMVVAKNGQVKGATTKQLVDFMLARVADPMIERFLASFPHFIDTVVVWQLIEARYYSSHRQSVIAFLKLWISQALHRDFLFPQYRDLRMRERQGRNGISSVVAASSKAKVTTADAAAVDGRDIALTPGSLYARLVQFLDTIPLDQSRSLKLLILKTKSSFESRLRIGEEEAIAVKVAQDSFTRKASRFFRADDRGAATTFAFTNDVEPRIWAEQLTLIEWDMFARLEDTEFYQLAWKQQDKEALAPNVCRIVQRFNQVSFWVATKIVMASNLKDRVRVVKKFVEMADECYSLGNFNSLMEILGGINTWAIQRLKQTWEAMPAHTMKRLEEFNNLMDSRHNYRAYRAALASFSPALPYLGVYLRDLTFIGEGNPDLLGRGSPSIINFEKMLLMGEAIRDIQRHRLVPYEFPAPKATSAAAARQYEQSLKQLRAYLNEVYGLREELLYKHSLFCEPSQDYSGTPNAPSKSGIKSMKGDHALVPLLDKGIRGAITDALELKVLKSMLLNHGAKDVAQAQAAAHKRAGKLSPFDTGNKIPVRMSSYYADLRANALDVNMNPVERTFTLTNNTGLRLRYKLEGDSALVAPEYFVAIEPASGMVEKGKSQNITVHAVAFAETRFSHVFEIAAEVEIPHDHETRDANHAPRRWNSRIFLPVKFTAPVIGDGCPQFWQLRSNLISNQRPMRGASANVTPIFLANLWGMDVVLRRFEYDQKPPSAFRKEVETATWEKQHNANATFLGAYAEQGTAALVFVRDGSDGATTHEVAGAAHVRDLAQKKKIRALKSKLATAQLANSRLKVHKAKAASRAREMRQLKAEMKRLRAENHILRQRLSESPDLGGLLSAPSSGNGTATTSSTTSESDGFEFVDTLHSSDSTSRNATRSTASRPERRHSGDETTRRRTSSQERKETSSSDRGGGHRLALSIELPEQDEQITSSPRARSRSERAISTTTNDSSSEGLHSPRRKESYSTEAGNPFASEEDH